MKYDIPMDFYPSPVKLTAGQKQRIRSLVKRQLAGEKVYNVMPQRSLVPLLVLLAFCLLTGVMAAQPGVRDIVSEAAAGIVRFFVREEAETEEETLPETEKETEADSTVLEVGAAATVGDVRLTVDKVIRDADGFWLQLRFDHLTGTFSGDILQFDTLSLSINGDPENRYKNSDIWYDLFTYSWGESGIFAGEVFTLLDTDKPQESVVRWLQVGTEKPETGEYLLEIGRLFGCDTAAAEFVCTEYGDFSLYFTIPELPGITPTVRLEPMTAFRIGTSEYTLRSITFGALSVDVEITCGRDTVFSPDGYPDLTLTPVYRLFGLFNAASEYGLRGVERDAVYVQQYNLEPVFRDGVTQDTVNSFSRCSSLQSWEEREEDTVYYHFALQDVVEPDILQKLELRKMNGGQNIVIWEAES